jgi:hypothetical protein
MVYYGCWHRQRRTKCFPTRNIYLNNGDCLTSKTGEWKFMVSFDIFAYVNDVIDIILKMFLSED